jgi:hypothetical protein
MTDTVDWKLNAVMDGDHGVYFQLVRDAATMLTVSRRLRPDGLPWSTEDTDDLVQDFFAGSSWHAVLITAEDDDGLRALIYRTLDHLLIDQYRKTERGRLHRRVDEILRDDPFVEHSEHYWRRSSDPAIVFNGSVNDLSRAVSTVDIKIVIWRTDSVRRSPHTDRGSFLALLNAMFDCARSAIEMNTIVDVLANRLGLQTTSLFEEIDIADNAVDLDSKLIADEDDGDGASLAAEIWTQLSPLERRMLPMMEVSSRETGLRLGIGKTQANNVNVRLKEKLRQMLEGEEYSKREIIVEHLFKFSRAED